MAVADQVRRLIAGNWKMNGIQESVRELEALEDGLRSRSSSATLVLCPPATLLLHFANRRSAGSRLRLGGQTCHSEPCGAFTGSISAPMLADAGAHYVIVGHSERRAAGESDAAVAAQAEAAMAANLHPILCVGESAAERAADRAADTVCAQLDRSLPASPARGPFSIAYEPLWAIGSGQVASVDQIDAMHGALLERVKQTHPDAAPYRILYGGSVNPGNAAEILQIPSVGGALVGGASLDAKSFLAIVDACPSDL